MDVYFISAVTWTPDRWNHNQPSSLLMYNPQQAVTELYNSSRNGPPCRVWISNVAGANVIASSFTSHDATACHPVEPLLCVCGLHFMVYLSVNPLYHAGGVTWWGEKNWAILWEARIFYRMCQQKPEHAFFCSHRTRCVFALWESVVVKWKEADTQVTAKGDRTFKGNIKAVMWRTGIIGVAKSEADWWIFKDRHESSNL